MNHHADAGSILGLELNLHWNANGFDARSRRPAQLENPLTGLQSGRLFDGVRHVSQQLATLQSRTFNRRLVRDSTPPPFFGLCDLQQFKARASRGFLVEGQNAVTARIESTLGNQGIGQVEESVCPDGQHRLDCLTLLKL